MVSQYLNVLKGCSMEGQGLDSCGPGHEQVMDSCEQCNEHSGSIKCGEILDCLGKLVASQVEGLCSLW